MVRSGWLKLTWYVNIMEHESYDSLHQCHSLKYFFALPLCFSGIHLCNQLDWNQVESFAFIFLTLPTLLYFLLLFCFGKQCKSVSALLRILTLQSEMNLLGHCLVFTLLYFTVLALSSFKFPGCRFPPKVSKLVEVKSVILEASL